MKITKKVKHSIDYSIELDKARQVAAWSINNKGKTSSSHVSHIGLKSAISNQILKKYGRNKKAKQVKNVKLTVPGQSIKIKDDKIYVPCLDLVIEPWLLSLGSHFKE